MSHTADNQAVLCTLAREGGRLTFSRPTYLGTLAVDRLARAGHVCTGQQAGGWDLVLVPQEPGS